MDFIASCTAAQHSPSLALCVSLHALGCSDPVLGWAELAPCMEGSTEPALPSGEYFRHWCKTNEKCCSFSGLQKLGCIERNVI